MTKDWFSYDPNGAGLEFHSTEGEAKKAAEDAIDNERDACDPEWSEEVDSICWGRVMGRASRSVTTDDETGQEYWDYSLAATGGGEG